MIQEFNPKLSKGIGPIYMILTKTGQSLNFIVEVLKQWLERDFTYISHTMKGHGIIPIRKYSHLNLLYVSTEQVYWINNNYHSTYVVNIRENPNATLVKETPEYLLYEVVQDSC